MTTSILATSLATPVEQAKHIFETCLRKGKPIPFNRDWFSSSTTTYIFDNIFTFGYRPDKTISQLFSFKASKRISGFYIETSYGALSGATNGDYYDIGYDLKARHCLKELGVDITLPPFTESVDGYTTIFEKAMNILLRYSGEVILTIDVL